MPAREQILDAAAALFTEHGFAATSTRLIAEKVGIRQASLYYHFATKDELLVELLSTSVRPSLEVVERISALAERVSAPAALYAVAVADVRHAGHGPAQHRHAVPAAGGAGRRVRPVPRGTPGAAGRLRPPGAAAAAPPVAAALSASQLGELLIQLVEVVIQIRRTREPTAADSAAIAASCLRLCGVDADVVDAAAAEAHTLLARDGGRRPWDGSGWSQR